MYNLYLVSNLAVWLQQINKLYLHSLEVVYVKYNWPSCSYRNDICMYVVCTTEFGVVITNVRESAVSRGEGEAER